MSNFNPLLVLRIALKYQYKVELCLFDRTHAYLRISNPFFKCPFPFSLDSKVCTYAYCKRLFDSLDIRYKI